MFMIEWKYYKMNKIILQVYNTYIKRQFKKILQYYKKILKKYCNFILIVVK